MTLIERIETHLNTQPKMSSIGYALLHESLDEMKKYQWISTKIAKPTTNHPVLATTGQDTLIAVYIRQYEIEENENYDECAEFNEVDQSYYLIEGWYELLTFWQEYTHLYIDQPVTHWMPLFTRPAY